MPPTLKATMGRVAGRWDSQLHCGLAVRPCYPLWASMAPKALEALKPHRV